MPSNNAFWSNVIVKNFTLLQNISILNKGSSFELSIRQRILKKILLHDFHKNMTLIIIRNVSNQHIGMIFEETCDPEAWSNETENSALITRINYIWQNIQMLTVILNCNNTSQYYCFYCNFWLHKCSLGEHKGHLLLLKSSVFIL